MKRRAPAAEETVVAAPAPAATVDASKGGQ